MCVVVNAKCVDPDNGRAERRCPRGALLAWPPRSLLPYCSASLPRSEEPKPSHSESPELRRHQPECPRVFNRVGPFFLARLLHQPECPQRLTGIRGAAGGALVSFNSGEGTRSPARRRRSSEAAPAQLRPAVGAAPAPGGCACLRTCCRTSGQRRQRSHSCHRPPEPPHGRHQQRPLTVSLSGCHQRGCKAVPEAELPKHLPAALLMSPQQGAVCSGQRAAGCEQEKSEFCSIPGAANGPRAGSASGSQQLFPAPGERFRCHPVGTAVLILLLLVLVLALGAALAVLAAPQVPVTPATPLLVQSCPHDWIGYNGVCYYFSRDFSTWEQGQERCSELNASLAIAQDEEAMDLLSRLCGNFGYWLGLRRRGERLHWGDGSSYSSR
ncbi:uncharacterized protein RBU47_008022 [Passerculus sandwichensis]